MLTNSELEVLRNIIACVETGGYEWGTGNYADFTPAYANSYSEHGITIGKYQFYATAARDLLRKIQKADKSLFSKLDTEGIASDLVTRDWEYYKILEGSAKAKCIQTLISTDVGRRVQDEVMDEELNRYVKNIENLGVKDHQAIAMAANWEHQGGLGAVKRILAKTKKPYTLDNLYNASKTDTGNQVGAYKTRQKFVYDCLIKYWPDLLYKKKYVGNYQVTGADLYFRVDAGKENEAVGILKEGTIVKCNGYYKMVGETKWYSITYDDKAGYSSGKYLTKI